MDCTIDIVKEGNGVIAYLPFNPRTCFHIPKGTIYVRCTIGKAEFKSKLMSKGNDRYVIFFSKQLIKNLGLEGNEHFHVPISIVADTVTAPEPASPDVIESCALKVLRERSSVRSFDDKTIEQTLIRTILQAGFCAPSAMNKRPFHFLVTEDKAKMLRVMGNNPYAKMLGEAAACIVVCGDKVVQGIPEWLLADCSAATQNMLLAIHSLGLGGVWCGVKQGSDFYKNILSAFNMPGHIRPVSLIALGYTHEKKDQPSRYETAKTHFETW